MSQPEGRRDLGGSVTPSVNMIAAQFADEMNTKQQKDLIKQHTDAAFEAGIKKHGHWDLTPGDSKGVTDPHFDSYFRSVKSINPRADEAHHRKEFEGVIERRAAELHGWGARKAENKFKTMGSRVASGIAKMFGLGEGLQDPVGAAVDRVMDTIGEMDKSERKDVNARQVAMIVNATGKRLPAKHHDAFREEVRRRIKELG